MPSIASCYGSASGRLNNPAAGFAPTERIERDQDPDTDFEMVDTASDRQDATNAFIADDTGKQRSNRKGALHQIRSFMLIGAYSTPTNTSAAVGPDGSGRSTSSSTPVGFPNALIIAARIGDASSAPMTAEIDEIASRERASGLLQPATPKMTPSLVR
jgi:hypothetical protein